jgi:hypothetical protein
MVHQPNQMVHQRIILFIGIRQSINHNNSTTNRKGEFSANMHKFSKNSPIGLLIKPQEGKRQALLRSN